LTGQGLDQLLETLLLTADLHELTANPNRPAMGTCIEAHQEAGRGVIAKVVVQNGTLRVGDIFVCGETSGRVQAMYDTLKPNRQISEAGPSMPVNVAGLDSVPAAGEHFYVIEDIATARQIAGSRETKSRQTSLGGGESHVTLENLFDRLGLAGQVQSLNLILRADVRGSIDAILKEIGKFKHDEVKIRVLQSLVGGVTEADVHLAHASDAIIIGFNVVADESARILADRFKVSIRRYDIIYKLSEDLKQAVEGKLKPEQREVDLGRALVQQVFPISRVGTIAGCRVISGNVARNGRARVIRDSRIIGEYPIESLKREKDDAREVREGLECGIRLSGFNDIKQGDVLEVYRIEEVKRTLD
jgi:translation initiation factor IF-2